jgi:hypothetical protein
MPIDRDFLNGDGSLPILFHVSESFEVWDGQVALVIDHLLNHIKVLNGLAEGPADQTIVDVLSRYPHYQMGPQGYLEGASRETVAQLLIRECLVLLRCLARIAPIMEIDQAERSRLLEKVKARIPFLDYRYVGDKSELGPSGGPPRSRPPGPPRGPQEGN